MATCDAHGYRQLQGDRVDTAPWQWRRVWASRWGLLSVGIFLVFCKVIPCSLELQVSSRDLSKVENLGNVLPGSRDLGMHALIQKPFMTMPSHQVPATGGQPFSQSARIRQFMQPASARHFMRSAALATTVAAAAATVSAADVAKKAAVLSALDAGMDPDVRAALAPVLPLLEACNPTSDPAFSEKLVGKWMVRYTGGVAQGPVDSPTREIALLMYAGGFGPGNAALSLAKRLPDNIVQVNAVSLEVTGLPSQSSGESRANLALRILDGQQDVDIELLCELVASGSAKLVERVKEVRVNSDALANIPEQLRYTRDLYVTYLDDELLVVRDATGSPDILVRKGSTLEPEQFDATYVTGGGKDENAEPRAKREPEQFDATYVTRDGINEMVGNQDGNKEPQGVRSTARSTDSIVREMPASPQQLEQSDATFGSKERDEVSVVGGGMDSSSAIVREALAFPKEDEFKNILAQDPLARNLILQRIVPAPVGVCYGITADATAYPKWMPFVLSGTDLGAEQTEVSFGLSAGPFGRFEDSVKYNMTLREPGEFKESSVDTSGRACSDNRAGFRYGTRLVWDWRVKAISQTQTEVTLDLFLVANSALLLPAWDVVVKNLISSTLMPAFETRAKALSSGSGGQGG